MHFKQNDNNIIAKTTFFLFWSPLKHASLNLQSGILREEFLSHLLLLINQIALDSNTLTLHTLLPTFLTVKTSNKPARYKMIPISISVRVSNCK